MANGEQRRFPRLSVQQTRIRNSLLSGKVVNLSLGGLAMESTAGMRIGSLHRFRVDCAAKTFRVEGKVCWCRLSRTVRRQAGEVVPIFRTGIAFTESPTLFSHTALQSSGAWLDLPIRVE